MLLELIACMIQKCVSIELVLLVILMQDTGGLHRSTRSGPTRSRTSLHFPRQRKSELFLTESNAS